MAEPGEPGEGGNAVERSVEALRSMIRERRLLPGEQIRQVEMAEQLQLSRVPLREALKVLETEGVVSHTQNRGYFVTRLSADDLAQIYLMRELLESAILRSIVWPDTDQLRRIADTNDQLQVAIDAADLQAIVARNRDFHYLIYELSPLGLIGKEVRRLWSLSEPYRAVYLYDVPARDRILSEHRMMIDALEQHDRERLVHVSDQHRSALQKHLGDLLA
jgi:DNA-binding GntR family transcriptional regulator